MSAQSGLKQTSKKTRLLGMSSSSSRAGKARPLASLSSSGQAEKGILDIMALGFVMFFVIVFFLIAAFLSNLGVLEDKRTIDVSFDVIDTGRAVAALIGSSSGGQGFMEAFAEAYLTSDGSKLLAMAMPLDGYASGYSFGIGSLSVKSGEVGEYQQNVALEVPVPGGRFGEKKKQP